MAVHRVAGSDKGPAFGAARLARLALTGEAPADVCSKPEIIETIAPDEGLHAAYGERFRLYQSLYRSLKTSSFSQGGSAPGRDDVMPAALAAKLSASVTCASLSAATAGLVRRPCWSSRAISAAENVSPAPIVSATFTLTLGTATETRFDRASAPASPRVMMTSLAPRSSQAFAKRVEGGIGRHPGKVVVTELDDVGKPDEALETGEVRVAVLDQRRADVGVERDDARDVLALHQRFIGRAAGLRREAERAEMERAERRRKCRQVGYW